MAVVVIVLRTEYEPAPEEMTQAANAALEKLRDLGARPIEAGVIVDGAGLPAVRVELEEVE